MALCANRPIHLALDNKSIVSKLNTVLRLGSKPPLRPWSLQADGDLWEIAHDVLRWRGGATSTVINWCKGHADDSHIHEGITDTYRAWGNDLADKAAATAHGMMSDCQDLCAAFRRKH